MMIGRGLGRQWTSWSRHGGIVAAASREAACRDACRAASTGAAAATAGQGGGEGKQGSAGPWAPILAVSALTAAALGFSASTSSSQAAATSEEVAEDQKQGRGFFEQLSTATACMRKRTFFKYEKRIRDMSPLEKVYSYFASQERDGTRMMQVADILPAIVPVFPPEHSDRVRNGRLPGEPLAHVENHNKRHSMLADFDVDGDGLISFSEFLLMICLLSVREHYAKTIFECIDINGSKTIDRDEFLVIVHHLQEKAKVHPTGAFGGIAHGVQGSDIDDGAHGLMKTFFGNKGNDELTLAQFTAFIKNLHEEMDRLEFEFYDWDCSGKIQAVDFARSIITSLPMANVDGALRQVDGMKEDLKDATFSYKEFYDFTQLRWKATKMGMAINFFRSVQGHLNKDDFNYLTQKVLGITLNPKMVDIIFTLYSDSNGTFNDHKFIEAMHRHRDPACRRGVQVGAHDE